MRLMHNLFVPRARQLTFAADITVHSLDNVPMVSGLYYAKLKLPSHATLTPTPASVQQDSPDHHPPLPHQRHATSHSNTSTSTTSSSSSASSNPSATATTATPPASASPRVPLRDHSVSWHWRSCFDAAMVKDDQGVLEPWPFLLVIKLDRSEELKTLGPGAGTQTTERLGVLHLDLAHFAGPKSVTTRKFLLQETRINSTVKITIAMTLKSGDPLFKVPELPSDMQIDLSRFTKSMGGHHHHHGNTGSPYDSPSTADTDVSSSVMRSGSLSDNSSLYSSRIASAAHRATTAPVPSHLAAHDPGPVPHTLEVLPSSSSGLSRHSAASLGALSPDSATPALSPSAALHLPGALPRLPNADPRPSAAIVDDLFSHVLASAKAAHRLAPPEDAARAHVRRMSGGGAAAASVSSPAQVTAIFLGAAGDAHVHARRTSAGGPGAVGKGAAGGVAWPSGAARPAVG